METIRKYRKDGQPVVLVPQASLLDTDQDELPVSVTVEGATFHAVYGVVGNKIELMSSDVGEGTAMLDGMGNGMIAQRLLRTMASDEISRTKIPFMPG